MMDEMDRATVKIKVIGNSMLAVRPALEFDPRYTFVYDPDCADYDWLVVFDEMPDEDRGTFRKGCEPLACPRERTILCTWEPVSIKSYSRAYTRQFGHLLTNRPFEADRHPHPHLGRGYFPWFVSRFPLRRGAAAALKSKGISAVCSGKRMKHTRHNDRYLLVETLARSVPGLEWYGKGVRPLAHKEDALDAYRYHVAIENHIAPHHWTEKFADAILCECLPFYAGDPALTEIFPAESFIPIPIDDPREAVRIVNDAIATDQYAKRVDAILEAKRLIFEKYNFWAQVIGVIESASDSPPSSLLPPRSSLIYARKALRWHDPAAALEDGADHLKRFLRII